MDPALHELASYYGIATDFTDWRGQWTEVAESTITAVLAAMGIDASNPQAAAVALRAAHTDSWRQVLPPSVVTRSTVTRTVAVHLPDGAPARVWAELGDGSTVEAPQWENWEAPRQIDGRLIAEATFQVPLGLPCGYHKLVAEVAGERHECLLAISPDWLGVPSEGQEWGVITQLYSVRSHRSWGMGDLADLSELARSSAEHGAGFVLVNPLHADVPAPPLEPSPYLPTTRRFMNPLYLAVADIDGYAELDDDSRHGVDELVDSARAACAERIDRERVWRAKDCALRAIFAQSRYAAADAAWREFCTPDLATFATWCAIAVEHGNDWRQWPGELHDAGGEAVARYRDEHRYEVDYHCWLQWATDQQLMEAQAQARRAGMGLGIVHDLAVGVSRTGAEAWSLKEVFAEGVSVGAPPDAFTHLGQDWGQPPWRPDQLARASYEPLRAMIAALLRHSGGLRVDHILGLFRLWWIPDGKSAREGTYVYYDHEAMVGILALEAWLAGAVVVGEDLGTVEPWVRTYLAERGILGTSILWWERDHDGDGRPLDPQQWREYCLASVTTHDLPPAAGYLEQSHVALRHRLGLIGADLAEELAADAAETGAWTVKLHECGYLTGEDAATDDVVDALHRYLAATPSRLHGVALVDMVGDTLTQNQPGTIDEYPNWRVPLSDANGKPMLLADVLTSERFIETAQILTQVRN